VSAEARLPGVAAPTLKESGVDVVIGNWRGLVGPPGMSAAGQAAMVEMLDRMHKGKTWAATLQKQGWQDAYLSGSAFAAFLRAENARMGQVLRDAGLVK
jgi:putative tricarboxylic transport membrane protein